MPWHTGCPSLVQTNINEAQLEVTRTGKVSAGFPGFGGQQPAPALQAVQPSPSLVTGLSIPCPALGLAGTSQPKTLQL